MKRFVFFCVALLFSLSCFAKDLPQLTVIAFADLPVEAQMTLALIKRGGPFPYAKDGTVFGNYEGILPKQKRGYYREYTVKTKNSKNRGAKRIIAGGNMITLQQFYFTDDHYATFKRIRE